MAKYYLLNSVQVGRHFLWAGTLIDDAVDNVSAIQGAGGTLWPSTDVTITAAAAAAQALKLRGSGFAAANAIMNAAVGGLVEGSKDRRRNAYWQKAAADGAAGTATAEVPFFQAKDQITLASLDIIPAAALTADATNNATITVKQRDVTGASVGTVATLVTDVAGGNWTQWVPKSMGALTNATLASGSYLTVSIAKAASGVAVPALVMVGSGNLDLV